MVWGPTGAPGRTTLAIGLAAELAGSGLPTVLVDADTYGASVAQCLGLLDESSGLATAAMDVPISRNAVKRMRSPSWSFVDL